MLYVKITFYMLYAFSTLISDILYPQATKERKKFYLKVIPYSEFRSPLHMCFTKEF